MAEDKGADTTGLARALDAEVVKRAYDEGLSPAVRQLGQGLGVIVEGLRLFTAPFALAATYNHRLAIWLEKVRDGVPREHQVECPPRIAGPVIQAMRFEDTGSTCAELYEKLLRTAIDGRTTSIAHPSYPRVIESMSNIDANLLWRLSIERPMVAGARHQKLRIDDAYVWATFVGAFHHSFLNRATPVIGVRHTDWYERDTINQSLNNLEALNLIRYEELDIGNLMCEFDPPERFGGIAGGVSLAVSSRQAAARILFIGQDTRAVHLTKYGEDFVRCCVAGRKGTPSLPTLSESALFHSRAIAEVTRAAL